MAGSGDTYWSDVFKAFRVSGFTATITNSFGPGGQSVDQQLPGQGGVERVIVNEEIPLVLHDGFGPVVLDTLSTGNGDLDFAWREDQEDLYTGGFNPGRKNYRYDGFTSTVLDSINTSGVVNENPTGTTWKLDSTDYVIGARVSEKYYQLDGFTTTLLNSIDVSGAGAPSAQPWSCYWDEEGVSADTLNFASDGSLKKIIKLTGFSTTVQDSIDITASSGVLRGAGVGNATNTLTVSIGGAGPSLWEGGSSIGTVQTILDLAAQADAVFVFTGDGRKILLPDATAIMDFVTTGDGRKLKFLTSTLTLEFVFSAAGDLAVVAEAMLGLVRLLPVLGGGIELSPQLRSELELHARLTGDTALLAALRGTVEPRPAVGGSVAVTDGRAKR